MKRPFFVFALIMVNLSVACCYLSEILLLPLCILSLLGVTVLIYLRKYKSLLCIILSLTFVLSLTLSCQNAFYIKRIENLSGSAEIVGRVVKEPTYFKNYSILTVKTEKVSAKNSPDVIYLNVFSSSEQDIGLDDTISATVTFSKIDASDKSYNYSSKIYIKSHTDTVTKLTNERPHSLKYYIFALRTKVVSKLSQFFSKSEASLLKGLILGDDSSMDKLERDKFVRTGVIHIMSVSGMHISIISQFIFSLLKLFKVSKRTSCVVTIVFILFLMIITGASPSVLRSGIMNIIALTGMVIFRESDNLNSLGFSVSVMLLYNAYYITDVSFVLSALSFLGIIVLSPRLEGFIVRKINFGRIISNTLTITAVSMCQSISACIFTLPVSMTLFGGTSTVSAVANFLINWQVTALMVTSIISLFFLFIPFLTPVAMCFVWISKQLIAYITTVIDFLSNISWSYIYVDSQSSLIFVGAVLIFIALWLPFYRFIKFKYLSAVLLGVTIAFFISNAVTQNNKVTFTAINVGDGLCVAINCSNEEILISYNVTDNTENIENYKQQNGIADFDAIYEYQENNLDIDNTNDLSYDEKYVTLFNRDISKRNTLSALLTEDAFTILLDCNGRLFVATTDNKFEGDVPYVVVTTQTDFVSQSQNTVFTKFKSNGDYNSGEYCMSNVETIRFITY